MMTHVKNYRSADLLACNQFISNPFPWKRTGLGRVGTRMELGRVGVKGKVPGQSRAAKVRVAEDQGDEPPASLRPGGQRPSGPRGKSFKNSLSPQERKRVLCTEDLTIVGGMGEKSYILINK